ncbi:hypothetical protein HPMG_01590 [Helicobacter pullorum MIT 98-5489]|uniref:Lipoprotein n=1 Tax=Helicobacter pullorum MIT 98-5489 TaxID=537972 RepID=C5F1I1_9HELI|nr:hypothetical protein HPMG_01590 [Helicobacter pullorum MIT 98-5489]
MRQNFRYFFHLAIIAYLGIFTLTGCGFKDDPFNPKSEQTQ